MAGEVRVLIIDDNETAPAALRLAMHVQPELNVIGDAGLSKALALRPDIICLEISLPGSGGLDALVLLRQFVPPRGRRPPPARRSPLWR